MGGLGKRDTASHPYPPPTRPDPGMAVESLAVTGLPAPVEHSRQATPSTPGFYLVLGALAPMRTSKFSGGMGLGGTGRWVPGAGRGF